LLKICEQKLMSETVESIQLRINGTKTLVHFLQNRYKDWRKREHVVAEIRLGNETVFLAYFCNTEKQGLINLLEKHPAATFDYVLCVLYNNKIYDAYESMGKLLLTAVEKNVPPSICPLITEITQP